MKRIDLSNLLASSSNIAMFADKIAQMIERLGGDHGMVELKHDRVVLFFRSICQVIDTAEWLKLPATVSAAKRAQVLVGRLARSDRVLISRPVGREIVAAAHQLARQRERGMMTSPDPIRIFYSWQSDRDRAVCGRFIAIALAEAIKALQPSFAAALVLDSDTAGVAGTPPVSETILAKIRDCDLFVGDVSFVGATPDGKKLLPNPNVMTEFGYARHALDDQ